MDFLLQLRTLLWKNYTLRRKKKLRLIAELIWPLIIFSVLVIIKIRFNNSLITEMEECHFEDMSLPSAGLFSFLRSYYCNVDIPCYSKVKDGLQVQENKSINWTAEDQIRHLFLTDRIFEVTNEFENFFNLLSKIEISKLVSDLLFFINNDKHVILQCEVPLAFIVSPSTLNELSFLENSSLLMEELYAFANSYSRTNQSLQMFPTELLMDICNKKKILNMSDEARFEFCELKPEISLKIFKEAFSSGLINLAMKCSRNLALDDLFRLDKLFSGLSNLFGLRLQLNKTLKYFQEVRDLMYLDNRTSNGFSFQRAMCGPISLRNSYTFLKLLNPSGLISPKAFTTVFFSPQNKTTNFCNHMMKSLKIMKQFLVGKIIYTPVTESTKNIIKMANKTFEDMEKLVLIISDIKVLIPDLIELSKNAILEEARIIMTIYSVVNFSMANQLFPLVSGLPSMLLKVYESLELILQFSECFDFDKFIGIQNEEELIKLGLKLSRKNVFLAGLVFSEEDSKDNFPLTLNYKIRLDQTFVDLGFKYNIEGETKRGNLPTNPRIASRFLRSGFVFIQDLIEHAILTMEMQMDSTGSVIQMFPSPCYVEDVFKLVLIRTFPLFMTLAWLIMVPIIVKDIVYEKEMKLKEFMKVMGLSKSVHWVSWFVFYFGSMSISVLLLSLLVKLGNILQYADIFLVILFLLIFLIALISQCFMFSVFFNLSNAAASFSAVAYFAAFLPFRIFVFHLDSMHHWHKLLASLSFTTAFGFGCNSLAIYESRREGMQWHYLFSHPTENDRYSFATSMIMMLFDSMLYLTIALYVEAVFPGEYGQAKSWHFFLSEPFKRLNICRFNIRRRKNKSLNNSLQLINSIHDHLFEANRDNFPVGVHVQNLTKKYGGNQPPAVNNLTIEFYNNQISGLLGHNGAGKTTTMFIMTGLLTATQGTVFIKNFNVASDIKKIRKIISFCPQHNILYDYLSVWQHLQFYSKLRGLSGKELDSECNRVISDVKLFDKKNTEARHLSGGMKRRLSIGIAYLGSPEVVILDEPTAGVDARARRFIWDLLLMYKLNRTTIMSTHLMEEAEVLSDRLAIINRGKLYCSGSLMYLKNRFASGYRLTTEIRKENVSDALKGKLVDLVMGSVTDAEIDKTLQIPHGETFILPLKSSSQFPALFKELELNRTLLSLSNYGISSPTVEEIFVNINEAVESRDDLKNNSAAVRYETQTFKPCPKIQKTSGMKMQLSHLTSLMLKRFYYFKRNKKTIFCQLILPPIFVMALVLILKFALDVNKQDKALELNTRIHASNASSQINFFLARNEKVIWHPKVLESSLVKIFGLDDDCLDSENFKTLKNSCQNESFIYDISYSDKFQSNFTVECDCSTGFQRCDSEALGTLPKSASLSNGDVVYNLTHFDIPDYLSKTHQQFYGKRFGGFEFVSTTFPRDSVVEVIANALNITNQVAIGMQRDISYKIHNVVEELRAISPSLLRNHTAKVWFNYEKPASMVTYLNSLHNAFLRTSNFSKFSTNKSRIRLRIYDHPLNSTDNKNALAQSVLEILPSVCIMFAVTIIPTSFLIFLIEERQSGFMHLQLVSGVHPTLYWMSNFIWDLICYILASSICIGIFYCFQMEEFTSSGNAPAFVCLLFFYGLAVVPLTYFFTFVFEDGNTAYIFTSGGYFFSGLIPSIVMFVFDFIPDAQSSGQQLQIFFMIIPQFCLGRGLMEMARNQMSYSSSVAILGGDSVHFKSPLNFDLVGKFLLALTIFSFVSLFFFLAFVNHVLEECLSNNKFLSKRNNDNFSNVTVEEDVLEEERRIKNELERNVLVVRDVTKIYRNLSGPCRKHETKALDCVTFGVKEGECFGLLGTNGAGKTTLFKILTGDIRPTSGDAFIDNLSVNKCRIKVRNFFGYCPQVDALSNLMTVREHLVLFSKLRGASGNALSEICEWGLKNLDLNRDENTLSKNLSGGNKRKLSVALSLIGSPRIVYMDEPTAGIDPRARRSVWNCVLGTVSTGQSVILTSHSLEECEYLCNRASIIVNGSLRCIGTIQHLKSKYTEGYNLSVKFAESVSEGSNFEDVLFRRIPNVIKKEQHDKFRTYSLQEVPLDLAEVFRILLDSKEKGEIEDFSINQTTLEQVFLKFATDI